MSEQPIRNRIKEHRRVRAGDLVPHFVRPPLFALAEADRRAKCRIAERVRPVREREALPGEVEAAGGVVERERDHDRDRQEQVQQRERRVERERLSAEPPHPVSRSVPRMRA